MFTEQIEDKYKDTQMEIFRFYCHLCGNWPSTKIYKDIIIKKVSDNGVMESQI